MGASKGKAQAAAAKASKGKGQGKVLGQGKRAWHNLIPIIYIYC